MTESKLLSADGNNGFMYGAENLHNAIHRTVAHRIPKPRSGKLPQATE